MTRRALGRGLSALLSEAPAKTGEEMQDVDIAQIEPSSFQPRTNFNEKNLEELAQSIRANGVIQPLILRRVDGDRFQLVAGERRWRAAQRAGLQRVPAVIREIPDDKVLELALIENIQRQELNAIEEAYAYKRLIETLGLTQEMVAERVGRDRTYVTNYLRLLRLPEDVQRFVEEEKLTMGHARALLGIDNPDIQRQLARNIIEQNWSVRETERAIKRIISKPEELIDRKTIQRSSDPNIRAAEDKLRRKFATQVRILANSSKGGGKIEIEYYNNEDLQRIYQSIMEKPIA